MAKKTRKTSWVLDDDKAEEEVVREVPRVYTEKIKKYRNDLLDVDKRLVFAKGLPHTGKTLNAIEAGVIQVCKGTYEKLVIIRPVIVPEFGLLPGTLEDKMALYIRQAKEYVNGASMEGWINLMLNHKIEILPADQLQGNHFRNSYVVIDECQNISVHQTFKALSRIGDGAKFVIIGDTSLGQENEKIKHDNMLQYSINKFEP
jgi:PhoH-like ATPase